MSDLLNSTATELLVNIRFRRATEAEAIALDPVLALGEVLYIYDKNYIRIGDGEKPFTELLPLVTDTSAVTYKKNTLEGILSTLEKRLKQQELKTSNFKLSLHLNNQDNKIYIKDENNNILGEGLNVTINSIVSKAYTEKLKSFNKNYLGTYKTTKEVKNLNITTNKFCDNLQTKTEWKVINKAWVDTKNPIGTTSKNPLNPSTNQQFSNGNYLILNIKTTSGEVPVYLETDENPDIKVKEPLVFENNTISLNIDETSSLSVTDKGQLSIADGFKIPTEEELSKLEKIKTIENYTIKYDFKPFLELNKDEELENVFKIDLNTLITDIKVEGENIYKVSDLEISVFSIEESGASFNDSLYFLEVDKNNVLYFKKQTTLNSGVFLGSAKVTFKISFTLENTITKDTEEKIVTLDKILCFIYGNQGVSHVYNYLDSDFPDEEECTILDTFLDIKTNDSYILVNVLNNLSWEFKENVVFAEGDIVYGLNDKNSYFLNDKLEFVSFFADYKDIEVSSPDTWETINGKWLERHKLELDLSDDVKNRLASINDKTDKKDLEKIAFSGDYNDLKNKPSIINSISSTDLKVEQTPNSSNVTLNLQDNLKTKINEVDKKINKDFFKNSNNKVNVEETFVSEEDSNNLEFYSKRLDIETGNLEGLKRLKLFFETPLGSEVEKSENSGIEYTRLNVKLKLSEDPNNILTKDATGLLCVKPKSELFWNEMEEDPDNPDEKIEAESSDSIVFWRGTLEEYNNITLDNTSYFDIKNDVFFVTDKNFLMFQGVPFGGLTNINLNGERYDADPEGTVTLKHIVQEINEGRTLNLSGDFFEYEDYYSYEILEPDFNIYTRKIKNISLLEGTFSKDVYDNENPIISAGLGVFLGENSFKLETNKSFKIEDNKITIDLSEFNGLKIALPKEQKIMFFVLLNSEIVFKGDFILTKPNDFSITMEYVEDGKWVSLEDVYKTKVSLKSEDPQLIDSDLILAENKSLNVNLKNNKVSKVISTVDDTFIRVGNTEEVLKFATSFNTAEDDNHIEVLTKNKAGREEFKKLAYLDDETTTKTNNSGANLFDFILRDSKPQGIGWVASINTWQYRSLYTEAYDYLLNQIHPTGEFLKGVKNYVCLFSDGYSETTNISVLTPQDILEEKLNNWALSKDYLNDDLKLTRTYPNIIKYGNEFINSYGDLTVNDYGFATSTIIKYPQESTRHYELTLKFITGIDTSTKQCIFSGYLEDEDKSLISVYIEKSKIKAYLKGTEGVIFDGVLNEDFSFSHITTYSLRFIRDDFGFGFYITNLTLKNVESLLKEIPSTAVFDTKTITAFGNNLENEKFLGVICLNSDSKWSYNLESQAKKTIRFSGTRYFEYTNGLTYFISHDRKIILLTKENEEYIEKADKLFENTGSNWFFILDEDNQRFKLPRSCNFLRLTDNPYNFSFYEKAKAPDIVGSFYNLTEGSGGNLTKNDIVLGAFKKGEFLAEGLKKLKTSETERGNVLEFSASNSNRVYGRSENEIIPRNNKVIPYFFLGDIEYVRSKYEISLGSILEVLSYKTDIGTLYNNSFRLFSPDYDSLKRTILDKNSKTFATSRDGFIQVILPSYTTERTSFVGIEINNVVIFHTEGSFKNFYSPLFPVRKGQEVTVLVSGENLQNYGSFYFYPLLDTLQPDVPHMKKVKTPKFIPNGGTFVDEVKVAIETETEDAKIYYSFTDPDVEIDAIEYKGIFVLRNDVLNVDQDETLRLTVFAKGKKDKMEDSDIAISKEFIIQPQVKQVTIDTNGGTFHEIAMPEVHLSCATQGAKIYYSFTDPKVAINVKEYKDKVEFDIPDEINVDYKVTFFTKAIKENFVDSNITNSREYIIIGKVKEPKILPEDSTVVYDKKVTVTLVPHNEKDKIKYKLSKTEENFIDYTDSFEIKENNKEEDGVSFTEVFAKSVRDGMDDSEIVSKRYKISKGKIPNPIVGLKSGTYTDRIVLTLETIADANIYYSFNSRTNLDLLYDKNKKITLPDDGIRSDAGVYNLYFQARGKDYIDSDLIEEVYSFDLGLNIIPNFDTFIYDETQEINFTPSIAEAKVLFEVGKEGEVKDITPDSPEYKKEKSIVTPSENSLKAKAFYKNDEVQSQVVSGNYKFKVKSPTIQEGTDNLNLSCETPNSSIYYSFIDPDVDIKNASLYRTAISKNDIKDNIYVKATRESFLDSDVISKKFN